MKTATIALSITPLNYAKGSGYGIESNCLNVFLPRRGYKVGAYIMFATEGRKVFQGPTVTTPWCWIAVESGIIEAESQAKRERIARENARPMIMLGDCITVIGFGDYRVEMTHNDNLKLVPVNGTDPETV